MSTIHAEQPSQSKSLTSNNRHPWTHMNWNNNPENFQFVIVTDRTGAERDGVFDIGIEKVNLLQPEFVVSVGDIIEGYTDNTQQIYKEWDDLFKLLGKLDMPFFFVPGNHDIGSVELAKIWKEKFGVSYYHFVYRDVLFLCLNSECDEMEESDQSISKEQTKYVKKVLQDHPDVRWTLVFMHRPVWRYPKGEQTNWEQIESLLQHRKHSVFAGHTHTYRYEKKHKQDYITLAAMGGGLSIGNPFMKFDHVLWVTMTDNGPIFANLMLSGIWDKDFTKKDVQDYLTVITSDKAVRIESKGYEDTPFKDSPIKFRLYNSQDIPMQIKLTFDESHYVNYSPAEIIKTIAPNSVEMVPCKILLNKDQWPNIPEKLIEGEEMEEDEMDEALIRAIEQLWPLRVRWEITYDFKQYGKIHVQGSRELY